MFTKRLICTVLVFMLVMPTLVFGSSNPGNLALNGDFSNGKDPWYVYNITSRTSTFTIENKGSYDSACAVIDNTSSGRLSQMITGLVGAKKGDRYMVSAKMKLATPGVAAEKEAYLRIGPRFSSPFTITGDFWTTLSFTYVVPEDITVSSDSTTRFQAYASEKKLEYGAYYIDDIAIYKIVEGSYFDPDKRWEYDDKTKENVISFDDYDNSLAQKLSDTICLKTDSNVMFARNNKIFLGTGVAARKVGESVMIPLRAVADTATMMVEWDSDANKAVVYNAYFEMKCGDGDKAVEILDFTTRERKSLNLSVPAQVIDGTLYFPLDSFCKIFEKNSFVSDNGLILISDTGVSLSKDEESKAIRFFEETPDSVDLYVSLTGSDKGDGSIENPFKTIEQAQMAARAYRDKDVTVHINEGEYELSKVLSFSKDDSKLGMTRTTFVGEGNVIINGGKKVTRWEKCDEMNGVTGIYRHKLESPKSYTLIYEAGEISVPARYPNRDDRYPNSSYLIAEQDNATSKNSFLYGEDFPELANPNGISVWMWPGGPEGRWRWMLTKFAVSDVNATTRKITLKTNAIWVLGAGSAYYIANDIKLLDVPGEYYIDETEGYLYYYPRDEKNLEGNIVVPAADGLINITGGTESPVSGIEFENLSLRNTDTKDLVYMDGVRNIRIEGCRLYSSGHYAVFAQNYAQNCIIRNCEVFDIAYRGIYFHGQTSFDNKYNRIENNHIYNVGVLEKSAPGILAQGAANTTIKNNTLHDGPRALINVSSTGPNDAIKLTGEIEKISSKNNLVAYNEMYNAPNESQDGAALYSYCTYRNVNTSNYVHDTQSIVNAASDHQILEGMYNDDLTCHIVNRYNLIANMNNHIGEDENVEYGVMYAGLRQKGAGSLVENNFVVKGNFEQGVFGTEDVDDGRKHGVYFYNNVGYTENSAAVHSRLFGKNGAFNILDSDYNLFYNKEGKYTVHSSKDITTLEQLRNYNQMNLEENTLTEDPRFVSYEKGDYRLRYDSPAHLLGTKDLNLRDIGVTADFKFADVDEEIDRMFVRFDGDSVEKSFRKLSAGQSVSLNVSARTKTGFVADLSNADITFNSDNTSIATVTESGTINALENGIANIVATITKNDKTLSLPVTVIVGDSLEGVKIKNAVTSIVNGKTAKLEYTVVDKTGTVNNNAKVSFTSSEPGIIEISNDGIMTAKNLGTAEIIITADDGNSKFSDKMNFTVIDSDISEIKLYMENLIIREGEKADFDAWAMKENDRPIILDNSNSTIKVSNNKIARVEGNTIVGLQHGKIVVTAEMNYYGRQISTSIDVLVVGKDKVFENFKKTEYVSANGRVETVFYDISSPNLLENGDFSNGLNGWTSYHPQFASINRTESPDGTPCVRIDTPSNSNEEMRDLIQRVPGLEASKARGKRFIVTAKVRVNEGTGTLATVVVYNYRVGTDEKHIWPRLHTVGTEWYEIVDVIEYNGNHEAGTIPIAGIRSWNDAQRGWYIDDFKILEVIAE